MIDEPIIQSPDKTTVNETSYSYSSSETEKILEKVEPKRILIKWGKCLKCRDFSPLGEQVFECREDPDCPASESYLAIGVNIQRFAKALASAQMTGNAPKLRNLLLSLKKKEVDISVIQELFDCWAEEIALQFISAANDDDLLLKVKTMLNCTQ